MFAILTTGTGRRQRFSLVQVLKGRGTNPTNGQTYRTEEAARQAAEALGLRIEAVGSLWDLI